MKAFKTNVDIKYRIYFICILALNGIDFLKNTQNGDVWSVAVNATGIVMFVLLGTKCSGLLLFEGKYKWWAFTCLLAAIVVLCWKESFLFGVYKWAVLLGLFSVWWISGMLAHYLLGRKNGTIEKRKWTALGRMAMLLLILMTVSKSGRVWPVWFGGMFFLFYATDFEEVEWKQLIHATVDATVLSFFVLQIFAYGFRPFDETRYLGAFPNSNINALHYLVVYTMILMKLHFLEREQGKKGWKFFYFLGAAALLVFIVLTIGRTAWITVFLETICFLVFVVRRQWGKKWMQVFLFAVMLGASFLLLFPIVFGTVRWLPTILHHPVWFDGEYQEEKVHSFDEADSEKYVEMDEFLQAAGGRVFSLFVKESAPSSEEQSLEEQRQLTEAESRTDMPDSLSPERKEQESQLETKSSEYQVVTMVGTKDMDLSTRIRLTIYKEYLKRMNFWGHPDADGHLQMDAYDYYSWHAQNLWIQVGFSYGIAAGILFLVMSLWMMVRYGKIAFYKREEETAILPFFICLIFFVYGMLELDWNVGQYLFFLFFFVQHPQFGCLASHRGRTEDSNEEGGVFLKSKDEKENEKI